MEATEKIGNFVVTFELKTEKYQEDIINKRLEILRRMNNTIIRKFNDRYKEMVKTKEWREMYSELTQAELRKELRNKQKEYEKDSDEYISITNELATLKGKLSPERKKELTNIQKQILKYNEFNEWGIYGEKDNGIGWKQYNHYKDAGIYANNTQKLCSNIWRAYEKLLFGNGKRVSFKKYGELNTIQGKNNKSALVIKFVNNIPYLIYNNFKIPVLFNPKKIYEIEALFNRDIVCSTILRKEIRNKFKYYVQITFKGNPFSKENQPIGLGDVGIDIGTQTIAITSDSSVLLQELANRTPKYDNEIRLLLRAMDRSQRASNPNNYNTDGTIKRGVKLNWIKSNNYKKLKSKYKELCRKKSEIITLQHNELSNEIIAQGNIFKVEKMSFTSLTKRVKKTEKSSTGKFKRKKRFGKSIANKAPSKFLSILKNKVTAKGGEYIEINTQKCRASQYNHITDDYKNKSLSQRWNSFMINGENIKIQRDIYSSYLIKNTNDDKESFNKVNLEIDFPKFIVLHDQVIEKIKDSKNLTSIGV